MNWIILSLLVIFASQLLLMIVLSFNKQMTRRLERKREVAYDELLAIYLDYFLTGNQEIEGKLLNRKDDPVIIERILMDYTKNVKGHGKLINLRNFAEKKLNKYYLKLLRSNKWSNRMNATLAIEHLELASFKKQLWRNLNRIPSVEEESILLMKTLARLGDIDLVDEILHKRKLSKNEYTEIFNQYETNILAVLVPAVRECEKNAALCALIHFIGFRKAEAYFSFLTAHLQDEDARVRLCALESMKTMTSLIDPQNITPFLMSDIWEERVAAANICGILKLNRHKQDLRRLMGDRVWTVRYTAGEAINRYQDGDIMLNHIAEEHEDRYARDMARQWIGAVS